MGMEFANGIGGYMRLRYPNQQARSFSPCGALFYLGALKTIQQKDSSDMPGSVLGPSDATANPHGPILSQGGTVS